jgi:hypothetical protein
MVSESRQMQTFMQSISFEHANQNVVSASGHKQLQMVDCHLRNALYHGV